MMLTSIARSNNGPFRRVSLVRPRIVIRSRDSSSFSFPNITTRSFHLPASPLFRVSSYPACHGSSAFNHPHHQVRWMSRKSGASAFDPKPRRWSKAQKKRFRRKVDKARDLEKHSLPGSKAGRRREYIEDTHEAMMQEYKERLDGTYYAKKLAANPLDDVEYTRDDALLDDVVGNAGHWTSQPTIEPVYTGDKQRMLFNRVADQMDVYQEASKALPSGTPPPFHLLPADKDIGAALRAFRDRRGTRNNPIGLAKALEHVLKELKIPSTSVFGEYTYNALLSCCRTPKEAVRIFQLMHQNEHNISEYSWSILIDVHAKVADFEGCIRAMDEMKAEGHVPNLPAYTSLLAACYKVCNDGRIAHSVRARAGEVGWEKWQELRIVGLDPDVMCYGAILRLCAARGQPERALNLLEEMPRFDVQPTTLCFSSALKAVAKSHETAVRYERGWSKKNKRREQIAAHHGKMARNIVLLAESAGVEEDDGFVAALQLCAAAAGDSATAKAIYLAAQVQRNMKHLRQVGSDEHLQRLLGEQDTDRKIIQGSLQQPLQLMAGMSGTENALTIRQNHGSRSMSYGEREYGTDTRTLSAILKACASACDASMIGEMWSGRENYGYLDLTSLRLIQERRKPQYRNTDIPGMSRTEAGIARMVSLEDMENPRKRNDPERRKRTRQNFPGMITLDDVGTNLDDLSDDMYEIFHDKETGMLKQEYIDSGHYPEYEAYQQNEAYLRARAEAKTNELDISNSSKQIEDSTEIKDSKKNEEEGEEVEWYFDPDARRWGTRPKQMASYVEASNQDSPASLALQDDNEVRAEYPEDDDSEETKMEEEWYFDDDARRWKTRMKSKEGVERLSSPSVSVEPTLTDFETNAIKQVHDTQMSEYEFMDGDEAAFAMFFSQLKQEMEESGEKDMEVDEQEARELFMMMKDEFSHNELQQASVSELPARDSFSESVDHDALPTRARGKTAAKKPLHATFEELENEWEEEGFETEDDDFDDEMDPDNPDYLPSTESHEVTKLSPQQSKNISENIINSFPRQGEPQFAQDMVDPRQVMTLLGEKDGGRDTNYQLMERENETRLQRADEPENDLELHELSQLLPDLPLNRLKKVRNAYRENLSDPSMLALVPILRENMPDILTASSLKAKNFRSAEYVLKKAEDEKRVDGHILNGMLQVYTAAGSLNKALKFYEEQFEEHNMEPTSYSDRLMIQMFVKNRRFDKVLAFKQKLEERGRKLDLLSYGPMIDYCSRHDQLGSAVTILKECIAVHGASPGEHYLKELRTLCRQYDVEEEIGLEDMIGKDPLEWLRHGEAVLRREKSYRGNRDISFLKNAGIRA